MCVQNLKKNDFEIWIAPDQGESIADYARLNDWLVVKIKDVPAPDFPAVSSKDFGIRRNKTHVVKQIILF